MSSTRFLRVHKSYIVDKAAVCALEGNLLHIGTHEVPIGRSRREEVLAAIF